MFQNFMENERGGRILIQAYSLQPGMLVKIDSITDIFLQNF